MEDEPAEEYYEEEEDSLGYYDDGTPRTLTDGQIAMFRHSEIQAIIRKRRLRRDNDDGSEEGEVEELVVERSASVDSPASQPTPTAVAEPGNVASGRVEKLKSQQWATSSARTKARNKKHRSKYKAKKKDDKLQREQARKNNRDEDGESDEWDPWHQAKGPDVQKDDTVDLDY